MIMSNSIDAKLILHGETDKQIEIDQRGLGAHIFDACDKYANNIFQVSAGDGKSETYSSFKKRSIRLAIALNNLGVTNNDIIAVCSNNSMDILLPIVASLFMGAKVTSLDPTTSKDEQKYLINIVKPKIIFAQQELVTVIKQCLKNENFKTTIVGMDDTVFQNMLEEKLNEENFKPIITDCRETAFVFFSSGSTSLPKGICVSHYAILYNAENYVNSHSKKLGILSIENTYWSTEISLLMTTFKTGSYRVILDETFYNNIELLLEAIQNYKVTYALIPSMTTFLFLSVDVYKYDLSKFELMAVTGSKLTCEHLTFLRKKFKHTDIVFTYGQTELQTACKFNLVTDKQLYLRKPDSVGKLTKGVSAKIVNIETNEALGPKEEGELRIKSPCLMNGYYCNNECSLDEFGYHKTGDIAFYDEDECFYIVRRIKDMFKFKDWIILPFFIEQCLLRHPAVKEAIVFGIPHRYFGELPSALVSLNKRYTVKEEELIEFANEQLLEKDKLIGGLKIVDELPKTCTHKIVRFKARKIFLEMIKD